ncbi:hypothetical protein ABBQ32_009461 [Trebouxia sp. C0010 RCD-2024]
MPIGEANLFGYNSEHFTTAGRSVKTGGLSRLADEAMLLYRDSVTALSPMRLPDNLTVRLIADRSWSCNI